MVNDGKISLHEAIKNLAPTEPFSKQDMEAILIRAYPGKWKGSSIGLHLKALDINASENIKRSHPSLSKHAFLVKENGKYKRKENISSPQAIAVTGI